MDGSAARPPAASLASPHASRDVAMRLGRVECGARDSSALLVAVERVVRVRVGV